MPMPPLHVRINSAIESVTFWAPYGDLSDGHRGFIGKVDTWTFKIVRSDDCCSGIAETAVCGFGTTVRLKPEQVEKAFQCAEKSTA